tara:strand:- start:1724 stop:1987 length:264 start_codon:yes stop_codon:yes gene_type:complete
MSIPLDVEGLERKQHENPFNYTEDQLQEKQIALKTMKDLYPDVPPFYAEIVYDLCKNNTPEEIDIIKEKISNTPSKYVIPKVLEFNK